MQLPLDGIRVIEIGHSAAAPYAALVLAELARAGSSPGGARPKALVHFNPATSEMSTQAGQVRDAQAWLVKFPAADDETDSCAWEALYARMRSTASSG